MVAFPFRRLAQVTIGLVVLFSVPCVLAQQVTVDDGRVASGRVIRVGPEREIRAIAAASRIARDGDTVEVDAGDYRGDVAVWTQDRLTLRAVGGRARLDAAGASAEGKAIWVVRGGAIAVEGFEFSGARVAHRNGAGIRFERGRLLVRKSLFRNNENGILSGGDPAAELTVEDCEFSDNGAGDGYSHNLYVGAIRRLAVSGSHLHHARAGHLLKSRARENLVRYNRLTDEEGGRASYELEFPNGGIAIVIGNVIRQGASTTNPTLISFGVEGYSSDRNALYLANNTLIDDRPAGGVFLRVSPGSRRVLAVNNLLVGNGSLESAGDGDFRNNFTVGRNVFASIDQHDYRLRHDSGYAGRGTPVGIHDGVSMAPDREYAHPVSTVPVREQDLQPGAMQSLWRGRR